MIPLECDVGECVKESIQDVFEKKYLWEDKEHFVGFKTEEERDIYCRGVKKGVQDALFWIADYHGLVEFFEGLQSKEDNE